MNLYHIVYNVNVNVNVNDYYNSNKYHFDILVKYWWIALRRGLLSRNLSFQTLFVLALSSTQFHLSEFLETKTDLLMNLQNRVSLIVAEAFMNYDLQLISIECMLCFKKHQILRLV